jgi:putative Ca2+/H+ antiporter (TMEM165/GDT1 family)
MIWLAGVVIVGVVQAAVTVTVTAGLVAGVAPQPLETRTQ